MSQIASPSRQRVLSARSSPQKDELVRSCSSTSFSDSLPESETADQLSSDDASSSPSLVLQRPRWHGTKDQFKYANRLVFDLHDSLKQIDSDALSSHLYNTHVLKRRLCTERYVGRCDTPSQIHAKTRWRDSNEWAPHSRWTAWPLDLKSTPLEQERWGVASAWPSGQGNGLQDHGIIGPDKELRTVLVAECVRWARLWLDHDLSQASRHQSADHALGNHSPQGSQVMSSVDSQSLEHRDQAKSLESTISDSADAGLHGDSGFLPTIILDEEEADYLLSPDIERIFAKLHHLLLALHHSRRNHYSRTALHRFSRDDDDVGELSLRATKRESDVERAGHDAVHKLPKRKPRVRDWSEVLGTAAHVGWDAEILEKVSNRCKTLLGETMIMQKDTGSCAPARKRQKVGIGRAQANVGMHTALFNHEKNIKTSSRHRVGWKCPENSCSSNADVFHSRERWLEHIQDTHGYRYDGVETVVSLGPEETFEDGFSCPDPDCERHNWPYQHRWRLQEHLKRKHGQRMLPRGSTPLSDTNTSGIRSEAEYQEVLDTVHVDGFLKPVKITKYGRTHTPSSSHSRSASTHSLRRPKKTQVGDDGLDMHGTENNASSTE